MRPGPAAGPVRITSRPFFILRLSGDWGDSVAFVMNRRGIVRLWRLSPASLASQRRSQFKRIFRPEREGRG